MVFPFLIDGVVREMDKQIVEVLHPVGVTLRGEPHLK